MQLLLCPTGSQNQATTQSNDRTETHKAQAVKSFTMPSSICNNNYSTTTPSSSSSLDVSGSLHSSTCSVDTDCSSSSTCSTNTIIEVSAGVFKPLRGSQETQQAWANGSCMETLCYVCDIRLACMDTCECVICPQCMSISPTMLPGQDGGVGLGIQL